MYADHQDTGVVAADQGAGGTVELAGADEAKVLIHTCDVGDVASVEELFAATQEFRGNRLFLQASDFVAQGS